MKIKNLMDKVLFQFGYVDQAKIELENNIAIDSHIKAIFGKDNEIKELKNEIKRLKERNNDLWKSQRDLNHTITHSMAQIKGLECELKFLSENERIMRAIVHKEGIDLTHGYVMECLAHAKEAEKPN